MSETNRPLRILRSISAVLAGFVIIVVLSLGTDSVLHATGVYPPWFEPMYSTSLWLLALAYRVVYGIVGSYVTARLAPYRPMTHALAGGVVGLVLSIMGTVATWNAGPAYGPKWFNVALVAIALPCAWLGGRLRVKQLHS